MGPRAGLDVNSREKSVFRIGSQPRLYNLWPSHYNDCIILANIYSN